MEGKCPYKRAEGGQGQEWERCWWKQEIAVMTGTMGQGLQADSKSWKGQGTDSLLNLQKEHSPANSLHLDPRTVKE